MLRLSGTVTVGSTLHYGLPVTRKRVNSRGHLTHRRNGSRTAFLSTSIAYLVAGLMHPRQSSFVKRGFAHRKMSIVTRKEFMNLLI